jgi:hypothetical protein
MYFAIVHPETSNRKWWILTAMDYIHLHFDIFSSYHLHRRQLAPEKMRNTPMCMQQYHFLFNTCRIPHLPSDYVKVYDPERYHHIAVSRKQHLFILPSMIDGQQVSLEQLKL